VKEVVEYVKAMKKSLQDREGIIQKREEEWESTVQFMRDNCARAAITITLNLRGKLFTTYKDNLLKQEGTFFHNMLSSGEWLPNEKGEYFIDRG
jgi:hypothetical protein